MTNKLEELQRKMEEAEVTANAAKDMTYKFMTTLQPDPREKNIHYEDTTLVSLPREHFVSLYLDAKKAYETELNKNKMEEELAACKVIYDAANKAVADNTYYSAKEAYAAYDTAYETAKATYCKELNKNKNNDK